MAICGVSIGSGCGQWAANAASVTGVSVLFITMSLQTRSIRSLLWWTRSDRFLNGGSSGIRRRGQRLRTGRTCKRRIISAMRKKATKPGKSSSATARAKSSSAPAKSQPGSPSSAQSVAANCSAGHAYANDLCSRCGKINPSGNLYKALGLWLKKHGNQTGNSQGYYLGREIGGFSITYDNRYPNEFEIAYYSEQPFENLSLTVSAAGSCSVYYSVGDYTTVNGHAPSNTAAHFEINKNSGVTAQQITFTDFYSKSTPKITQADFAKQSAAKTECSLKAANALLKPTGLSLKNFGFTGNYA